LNVVYGMWLILASGVAAATPEAKAGNAPVGPPYGMPVEQFISERCGGCHGAAGQGPNPAYPKLAGQRADYLFREMTKFRSGARKGTMMQVFLAGMEDREIAVLALHFNAQRRTPDSGDADLADEAGRLLYSVGNTARNLPACIACHDKAAEKTGHSSNAMAVPRLTGQHAAYLEDQLLRFVNGTRLPGQTPKHPVANRLDASEISSVSRYMSRIE